MDIESSDALVAKKCKPCEGGVAPYTLQESEEQLKALPGWYLMRQNYLYIASLL